MSEWYENKTVEELDGKRVRVEYENGTVVEGVLSRIGGTLQIRSDKYGTNVINILDNTRRGVKVNRFSDNIKLITPLGDGNMTRIDDINDVRSGDTFVGTDGNRYPIHTIGSDSVCSVEIIVSATPVWVRNSYFAYALRPTPQLPTEPGLYMDTDSANRLWIRTWSKIDGVYWRSVQDNNGMPIADLYTDEKMLAELHGATLYPVEIKRVES